MDRGNFLCALVQRPRNRGTIITGSSHAQLGCIMRSMWIAVMLVASIAGNAFGQGAVAKIQAHKHLGAATCASSVCHGAAEPLPGSNVMQNEFALWQEIDPHARAYALLGEPKSLAIARNLGIGDPRQAGVCLDCHADFVPADLRGAKFQLDDGVACEACHGGSEQWIASHTTKDTPHAENVEKGMYPISNPVQRAKLCLSCHMGTADRMITHRIMGAGHPRLSFELDTFTWLNPHYVVDDDYVARKGAFNGARDWGVGQGVAAMNLLDQLTHSKLAWQGIFPELVLFDCHACHKPMTAGSWKSRPGTGLGPGVVRLNDANLVVYRYVLGLVDAGGSARLLQETRALHQATTQSREATFAAAKKLRGTIDGSLQRVSDFSFDASALGKIVGAISADADRGEFNDYSAAEQAAMAAQSVIVAFTTAKHIDETRAKSIMTYVDRVYATVENGDRYDPARFVAAMRELKRVTL